MYQWDSFWLPSALMGLGIALDVAIATLGRFRNGDISWRNWTLPVTMTHIVFPAFGYYSWWALGTITPYLFLPLGVIAAVFVILFLWESFSEWIGAEAPVKISSLLVPLFPKTIGVSTGMWIAILAVSMDALWSGPAKAAIATSGGWSAQEVFWSFFIAGGVVAIVAEISRLIANWLRSIQFKQIRVLAAWCVTGKWIEFSVIGGFGLLSLWSAVSVWLSEPSLTYSIAVVALPSALLFARYWPSLLQNELSEFEND